MMQTQTWAQVVYPFTPFTPFTPTKQPNQNLINYNYQSFQPRPDLLDLINYQSDLYQATTTTSTRDAAIAQTVRDDRE